MTRRRALALGAALLVQVAALLLAVGPRLAPRISGDELRLQMEAFDPIEPTRGAYVALRIRGVPLTTRNDGRVFVPLRRLPDGSFRGGGTVLREPDRGPYLRCEARDGDVACGIESYFADQGTARRLGRSTDFTGRVRVDDAGRAALVGLARR